MYKKITAISLALIMTVTAAATPAFADSKNAKGNGYSQPSIVLKVDSKNSKTISLKDIITHFADSADFDWAQKSIEKMGAMGILSGIGNNKFMPKNNVTQAEAIAMVLKLTGYQKEAEAIKTQPDYFKGQCDSWSYGYLQLALDKGIIIPEEDGNFNPRTPAKRYEIAKYVVRALGKRDEALANMNAALNYKDAASIPKNAVGYVYVISNMGIMQGANNQFQPNKSITRAEMAVILDKAEDNSQEPGSNASSLQGSFVSYNPSTGKLTMVVNNKSVTYDVNPNTPVYKNSAYMTLGSLSSGDIIKVVVDSQKKIIFVEYKQGATVPGSVKLSAQTIAYDSLPQALKDKVELQKLTQNYTAYRYDQSIYLIASRGPVPTGGYSINIKEVYREQGQNSKYNLKAVIETANPGSGNVIQVISYPYTVVKLSYFEGIDIINFVDTSNTQLAQTTLSNMDITEVKSGKINTVDAANRTIQLTESDNMVRTYYIPNNVQITLNNQTAALSSLQQNMTVVLTKVNGVITKLDVQSVPQVIEVISGKLEIVDATNRIIAVTGNDGIARSYLIPSSVEITLNNQKSKLSELSKDMPVTITKTDSIITKIAAQNNIETLGGVLTDIFTSQSRTYITLKTGNALVNYEILGSTNVYYNNQKTTIQSIPLNANVTVKLQNNAVIEVRNK